MRAAKAKERIITLLDDKANTSSILNFWSLPMPAVQLASPVSWAGEPPRFPMRRPMCSGIRPFHAGRHRGTLAALGTLHRMLHSVSNGSRPDLDGSCHRAGDLRC